MSKITFPIKYGRLTAISESDKKYYWNCICDCGNKKTIKRFSIISGDTTSCGCYNKERVRETHTQHGLYKHKLFWIWHGIKQRCYNKNRKAYKWYGAKGITVCNEWINDFGSFYNWSINNGWRHGLEIDRIDGDGCYSPTNCRIVNHATNTRNKKSLKLDADKVIEIRNIKNLSHRQIAKIYGVSHSSITRIINNKLWKPIS